MNKAYLDEKLLKINRHISYKEKNYNEFKSQYNKQSAEEFLFQRGVKTIIQNLYDKGIFDGFPNSDEVLKLFCLLLALEMI